MTALRTTTSQRGNALDLIFIVGIIFKAIDGLGELIAAIPLFFVTPSNITTVVHRLTVEELSEDPHDLIANLLIHGTSHLATGSLRFLAIYFLIHGIVKLAIVTAIIVGAVRVYPWAITALSALTVFQIVEFVLHPSAGVAILTVLDIVIIALTWREWRQHRDLRDTLHDTARWIRGAFSRRGANTSQ